MPTSPIGRQATLGCMRLNIKVMKARFSTSLPLGLALLALPFVGACSPQSADQTSFISTANAEPAVAVVTTNTPAEAVASVTSPLVAADPDAVVAVPAPAAAPAAVADGEDWAVIMGRSRICRWNYLGACQRRIGLV